MSPNSVCWVLGSTGLVMFGSTGSVGQGNKMVELLSQSYYTKYVIYCHWIFGITHRYIFAMNILFYQVKMVVFYKFKQPI